MQFWGLLAMVVPTAHITQRNFLVCSFPKIEFFIGQDDVVDILVPIQPPPTGILPCIPLTHIYMSCISQFRQRIFKCTILEIVYYGKGQKTKHVPIF